MVGLCLCHFPFWNYFILLDYLNIFFAIQELAFHVSRVSTNM